MGKNNSFYGKQHTEETKDIIRKLRLGAKTSDKTKRKLSKTSKRMWAKTEIKEHFSKIFSGKGNPMFGRKGKDCPIYGRKYTKEHRNRIAKAKIGKRNPNVKKFKIMPPDGKEYIVDYGISNWIKKYPKYNVTKYNISWYANHPTSNNKSGWRVIKF